MTPDEEELLRAFAGGQDVEVARCDVESVLTEIDRLRESEAALRDEVGVLELALKVRKDKALEERVDLTAEMDVARAYFDEARSQLAALHAAAIYAPTPGCAECGGRGKLDHVEARIMIACRSCRRGWETRLRRTLVDLDAAAREHDARSRAAARADLAMRALDVAAEIDLPGHDGDDESGWHDEDCQRCALDALLAMLADEAERGTR